MIQGALGERVGKWHAWCIGLVVVAVGLGAALGIARWRTERMIAQGEAALEAGDFRQALTNAMALLRSKPADRRALELKARAAAGLGHWGEALRLFEQQPPQSPSSRRVYAEALLQHGRWSEALHELEQLDELAPFDPDTLHHLADCNRQLGRYDDALKAAETLSGLAGQEGRGALLLGIIHNRQGNFESAAAAWQKVLEFSPDATGLFLPAETVFLACGRAFLGAGNVEQGVACLTRSVALEPSIEARALLGEACELSGDTPRARELWEEVLRDSPENRASREGLARLALQDGKPADAVEWLRPVSRDSEMPSSTAYLLQRAYTALGDRARSDEWHAKSRTLREKERRLNVIEFELRHSPDSLSARAARAHQLAAEGAPQEAAKLVEALLREIPGDPFVTAIDRSLRTGAPLPPLDQAPLPLPE